MLGNNKEILPGRTGKIEIESVSTKISKEKHQGWGYLANGGASAAKTWINERTNMRI